MIPHGLATAGALGRRTIRIDEWCEALLRILHAGWQRALASPEVNPGVDEVPITEHLREGMRAELNESDADWCKRVTILRGTESRSSPDVTRPDGLTDIPVLFTDIRERLGEHDPHAIIECKRVAGNDAALCRQYVVEGMNRFATGKYASNHADGFMAGYLLSGTTEEVVTRINRYLTRKRRQDELLDRCRVLDTPWTRSSRHPRPEPAAPIDLHHAFLGFTSPSS